ncbi:MAG: hypothetical protein IJR50_09020 [Treponema sp.]|nr:hypothetical protein [Treponema sp.]
MNRLYSKLICTVAFCCVTSLTLAAERPIVTDITSEAGSGQKITVSWLLPKHAEPAVTALLVYKNTQPIYSYAQIETLAPVATISGADTGWTDAVSDYRDYYYAVVAVTERGAYDIIIPSVNATIAGVHAHIPPAKAARDADASAQETLYPQGAMRETPLPYIDLIEGMDEKPVRIGTAATEQAKLLAGSYAAKNSLPLDMHIFEEDLISPDGGDDYLLFDILSATFIKQNFKEAATQLSRLLATNRSASVTKRAQFYLAESYYFSGNYADAVTSFLQVAEDYPSLTKKWIDSALDFMQLPD